MALVLELPLKDRNVLKALRAGDSVLVSGTLYTGRDAAHKRLCALLARGEELPIPLQGQGIYYTGPAPAPAGHVIGACGPTTSYRMDAYAPALLERGLAVMIGKGLRSEEVRRACVQCGAVYLAAPGGAGAYLASCVRACEVVAFDDLGTEAIHRLTVENMALTVAIDTQGENLYEIGRQRYRQEA